MYLTPPATRNIKKKKNGEAPEFFKKMAPEVPIFRCRESRIRDSESRIRDSNRAGISRVKAPRTIPATLVARIIL